MNLREEFNRMDREAIDTNSKYYDLRNLLEAVNLTYNDKRALQDFINKNDAYGASAYLQGMLSGKPKANVKTSPATTLSTSVQNLQSANPLTEENGYWFDEDLDTEFTVYEVYDFENHLVDTFEDENEAIDFAETNDLAYVDFSNPYTSNFERIWTSESYNENMVTDELTEDVELEEGRHDLVPVKCIPIKSNKPYWSPYDKKERTFAKYGTRFRYDTREGCRDAIRDMDKNLGYLPNGEPAFNESFKLKEDIDTDFNIYEVYDFEDHLVDTFEDENEAIDFAETNNLAYVDFSNPHTSNFERIWTGESAFNESLILDEDLFVEADLKPKKIIFNGKEVVDTNIDPEIMQMVGSPVFKNGSPKAEAWILIKLYEATVVNGAPSIRREELLRQIGTALSDREGQSSTFFNNFTKLGLARLNRGDVYPGPNLNDWIAGNAKLTLPNGKEYAGGVDLRIFVGTGNLAKKDEQGANPNKSHRGRTHKQVEKPVQTTPNFSNTSVTPVFDANNEPSIVDLSFFDESLNPKEEARLGRLKKFEEERANKVKAAYRKAKHLEEDAEITPEDFDSYVFKDMCSRNGWNFDISKKDLLGRD